MRFGVQSFTIPDSGSWQLLVSLRQVQEAAKMATESAAAADEEEEEEDDEENPSDEHFKGASCSLMEGSGT